MIEYCIDKDGVISGASKEDLEILKDKMLAKIKDDIDLMCSITLALGKAEAPLVNVAMPWNMTPLDGDNMKARCWLPPLVQHSVTDSPAEYRRKMNEPWPDPRAGMAFLNRGHSDMLKGLQELLSEPGIAFMPFPADAEELKLVEFDDIERELEYWVGASYEEHLDDSGQRNFCKDISLGDDMCTKDRDGRTIHPKGWGDLRSDCSGAAFMSMPIGSTSCRLK